MVAPPPEVRVVEEPLQMVPRRLPPATVGTRMTFTEMVWEAEQEPLKPVTI